jgi:hypothetical protein
MSQVLFVFEETLEDMTTLQSTLPALCSSYYCEAFKHIYNSIDCILTL